MLFKFSRQEIPKRLRFETLRCSHFRCAYCSVDGVLQVDHIWPVSLGGGNDRENLTASCFNCNIGKSDRFIFELCRLLPDYLSARYFCNALDMIKYEDRQLRLMILKAPYSATYLADELFNYGASQVSLIESAETIIQMKAA